MTPEYQLYHGALLHEIITTCAGELRIVLSDFHGRPDAYIINGEIGLLIKHATARITPWQFTFMKEHVAELHSLRQLTKICFVGFVCHKDGFVCIRDTKLIDVLVPTESDVASVRIERRARRMYGVSSGGRDLEGKVAKGVEEIVAEIKQRSIECAPPSSSTSTPDFSKPPVGSA